MKRIVCYGEVLWDVLPTGKKLGGAPLNVTLRAQSLGNQATLISSIGNDEMGAEIIEEMRAQSADLEHIQVSKNFETSKVLVALNESGSASYEINKPCAWDDIALLQEDIEVVEASDAFVFGSLIARCAKSRETLFSLVEKSKFNVFDANLRPPHYTLETLLDLMKRADFIKLNDDEIFEICANIGLEAAALEECIGFIAKSTNTRQICVTRGSNGAVLYIDSEFFYNSGYQVTVADTVGSGDSFLAATTSKLLNGSTPQEAVDYACAVGAIVASKSGANPAIAENEVVALMQTPRD